MDLHTAQWDPSSGWSGPLPGWDGPQTLVMAYGGSALLDDPGALTDVMAAYPTSRVIGCSTAGEILGDLIYDDTLTVTVARFANTRLTLLSEEVGERSASFAAGLSLGKRLLGGERDMRAAFVLSDGLCVNGTELVAGLVDGTEHRVLLSGGLAGDDTRFGRTWVLVDGVPRRCSVTAVGFTGPDVVVSHGSRGGWNIFGPERRITRAEGNVLYELDGQPALALYKRYLGERAADLPASGLLFPLAVRGDGAGGQLQVVRTIRAVDESTQSLTLAGDISTGALAQLMRASMDRLIAGAHEAATAAQAATETERSAGGPTLAVAVSCVGRRRLLGSRTEDELEAVMSALPADTELVGFYSYGEISPYDMGTCALHNQTMTLTIIGEHATGDPS